MEHSTRIQGTITEQHIALVAEVFGAPAADAMTTDVEVKTFLGLLMKIGMFECQHVQTGIQDQILPHNPGKLQSDPGHEIQSSPER